jgi:4'-phosphopantetheinyl transferase
MIPRRTIVDMSHRTGTQLCYTKGSTSVWLVGLNDVASATDVALMSPEEILRMGRYVHDRDAAYYAGGHAAAHRLVGLHLGVPPQDVVLGRSNCPCCGSPEHGPPRIISPESSAGISLSRSGSYALVAIATSSPVGVDLESVKDDFAYEDVADLCLSEDERQYLRQFEGRERAKVFYRCWVRKEAVAKACGIGIALELRQISVRPALDGPVAVVLDQEKGPTSWHVYDLGLDANMLGALARPVAGYGSDGGTGVGD